MYGHKPWARALLGTPARMIGTGLVLLLLIVVAPVALLVAGVALVAAVVCVVGCLALGALVLALLPGRRR